MAKIIDGNNKNLRTCRRCRRLYEYMNIGYGLCPGCAKVDNEAFRKVKDYLMDNQMATAQEISVAVGVSEAAIYQYLRDGRIEIPENSPIYIKCEMCRGDIRYGRYCPECAVKAQKELNKGTAIIDIYEIGEKPKQKETGKMHTYKGRDRKA